MTSIEFYEAPFYMEEVDYSKPPDIEPLKSVGVPERVLMTGRAVAFAVAMTGLVLYGPSVRGTAMSPHQAVYVAQEALDQSPPPTFLQSPLSSSAQRRAAVAARLFTPVIAGDVDGVDDPDYDL